MAPIGLVNHNGIHQFEQHDPSPDLFHRGSNGRHFPEKEATVASEGEKTPTKSKLRGKPGSPIVTTTPRNMSKRPPSAGDTNELAQPTAASSPLPRIETLPPSPPPPRPRGHDRRPSSLPPEQPNSGIPGTEGTDRATDGSFETTEYGKSSRSSTASSSRSPSTESSDYEHDHMLQQFPYVPPGARNNVPLWVYGRRDQGVQARAIAERLSQIETQLEAQANQFEATSTSGSSDNGPSDDKIPLLWSRLQNQRQKIKDLRLEMSQKRREIQKLRRKQDIVDNAFMRTVRPNLVAASNPRIPQLPIEVLGRRFDELQSIRSDYNFAESQYETLELELDREEKDLQSIEMDFFSNLFQTTAPQDYSSAKSDDDGNVPPSRTSLLGISPFRDPDYHPLYRDLLGAVADRELAREHHKDLLVHRDTILYDLEMKLTREKALDADRGHKHTSVVSENELGSLRSTIYEMRDIDEFKARFGSSVRKEDMDFLRLFELEETSARATLEETIVKVDHLRETCIDKGVMRKNAPYHEEYPIYAGTENLQMDNNMTITDDSVPPADSLANPRFPILLSNPKHVLGDNPLTAKTALREATQLGKDDPSRPQRFADAMKEYGIVTLMSTFTAENKSDYINRWLLQCLRSSPIEAELLYSVFSTYLKVVNPRRWQEDVLYFWPRDAANIPPDVFEGPLTSRDDLELAEGRLSHVNWEILVPSRPGSERPDDSKHHANDQRQRSQSEPDGRQSLWKRLQSYRLFH